MTRHENTFSYGACKSTAIEFINSELKLPNKRQLSSDSNPTIHKFLELPEKVVGNMTVKWKAVRSHNTWLSINEILQKLCPEVTRAQS